LYCYLEFKANASWEKAFISGQRPRFRPREARCSEVKRLQSRSERGETEDSQMKRCKKPSKHRNNQGIGERA
jgi:hypothetical protein